MKVVIKEYPLYYCNKCKQTFLGTEENTEIRNMNDVFLNSPPEYEKVVVCPKGHFDWIYRKDEDYSDMTFH